MNIAGQTVDGGLVVKRKWANVHGGRIDSSGAQTTITVMSYNVLAQSYVSRSVFPWSPAKMLRGRNRRGCTVSFVSSHVEAYDVDILCLQEVESETICALKRVLVGFSFTSYKKRTEARGREKRDGSGIFWRKSKFQCAQQNENEHHLELNDISTTKELLLLIGDEENGRRDCVCALICVREVKSGIKIVIGSAHLFWDPRYALIKLAQAIRIRQAALELCRSVGAAHLVLAGDWNSVPGSAVFQYLQQGSIDQDLADLDDVNGANQLQDSEFLSYINNSSSNHVRLRSVHEFPPGDGHRSRNSLSARKRNFNNRPITTLTATFSGALDHIFVTDDEALAQVTHVLSLPTKKDLTSNRIAALPWFSYPSDHLPVIARVALNPPARC